MSVVDQLRQIVEDAERASQSEALRNAVTKAVQAREAARARYEAAERKLAEAKRHWANPDQRREAQTQELSALRSRAQRQACHISPEKTIETLIEEAKREIESEYNLGVTALQASENEMQSAKAELDAAMERHRSAKAQLEIEIGTVLQPLSATPGMIESPSQDIACLTKEIENSDNEFSAWLRSEQQAMLCIWAGRARVLQDQGGLGDDEQRTLRHVFAALNRLSKRHMPGFVEALNRKYLTDWGEYIKANRLRYVEAVSARKAQEAQVEERRQRLASDHARRAEARARAETYLGYLEDWCRGQPDAETQAKIVDTVWILLEDVKLDPFDARLVETLFPHRGMFKEGGAYRPLRRAFERYAEEQSPEEMQRKYPKVASFLANKRAVMIGGCPREERRQAIEKLFKLKELRWESCQGKEPRLLERVADRIKNNGLDLVLALTEFSGHQIEQLRPICESRGVPFIRVTQGYGAQGIAQAVSQLCPVGG